MHTPVRNATSERDAKQAQADEESDLSHRRRVRRTRSGAGGDTEQQEEREDENVAEHALALRHGLRAAVSLIGAPPPAIGRRLNLL